MVSVDIPRSELTNRGLVVAALLLTAFGTHAERASAQQAIPPTTPAAPASPVGSATIGSLVIPYNASIPQPNPNASDNAALPSRRGALKAEPFSIYPFLGAAFGYNSNLIGSDVDKVDSAFWVLSPRIVAELRSGASRHDLTYNGNFGKFLSSSADDFSDHEIIASTDNKFTARADFVGRAFYLSKSDARGLLARVYSDRPDKWHAGGLEGTFGYGARAAQGRVEGFFGYTDKKYENNRDRTFRYDLAAATLGARFFYRLSPKTRFLSEIQYRDYSYSSDRSLNNYELRYLLGATWEAAASTAGTLKLGYMTKKFNDTTRADYSGVSVDGQLRWEPRTYSSIDLVAGRSAVDSYGIGIYSVDTSVGLVWTHRWRSYLTSRASTTYVNSDYEGIARTDKFWSTRFGAYYDLKSWLKLGAEYTHQRRNSSESLIEFSRNIFMITLGSTL